MQAIILAAGMGKRLGELTERNTKCMVKVDGITLIERMLRILDKKKLSRIILVVGYQYENLTKFVDSLNIATPIEYIINEVYYKTNNIFSLSLAKERMMQEDNITDFIQGKSLQFYEKERYYKTVNIYKFGADFSKNVYVPFLEAYAKVMGNNEYYETVIKLILLLDKNTMKAKRLNGQLWYEIDDVQDLDIAETLFIENPEEKYQHLMKRYGGYWRFPHYIDYCYLVNPYFPTRRMKEELESNFEALMRQYPSGMNVNTLLAAKCFSLHEEHIVIGNGAAELIKGLLEQLGGTLGVIRPTFEEYPNRWGESCVEYDCTVDNFTYTADSLIEYFSRNQINNLVLINPDNPSGHFLSKKEIGKILEWCKTNEINLILDESFLDFAEGKNNSLLSERILCKNPNLYIVKSISKSYGVPGLRLGILASGNTSMIDYLKNNLSIWNINSMAEFFMQILDKYKDDYRISLEKLKKERKHFYNELCGIDNLKVYPSQANYFLCELLNGLDSKKLAGALLEKNILIKDLSGKIKNGKQYIRTAIRTEEENEVLLKNIKNIIE